MDLDSSIGSLPMVGPTYQNRLEKLGIYKIGDLLNHVPSKYLDYRNKLPISKLEIGDTATIKAKIDSFQNAYTKMGKKFQIVEVSDESGKISIIWFNQTYLSKMLIEGDTFYFSGKVDWFGRKKAMISPDYEKMIPNQEEIHTGKLVPIYPETSGLSSKWLRGRIRQAFENIEIKEFLPDAILKENNLAGLSEAINKTHFPKTPDDTKLGRARLAFNELFTLQLRNLKRKNEWRKTKSAYKVTMGSGSLDEFKKSLPFKLTASQLNAADEILSDLKNEFPMNRLLEGDVGSGKTVVAAMAAFASFLNGYQTVIMAPTQILAEQHFKTINNLFKPFKARINLVTSSTSSKELGRCDIFVGTHSLIHQKINFDKVALVVIDEQHSFGVEQREHLIKRVGSKKIAPHVLTMTATPIPQTVALTFYGDLDLSTLDEIPQGRQKITTWIVPPEKRDGAYSWIKAEINKNKSQVFIVCPLIDDSDKETMKDIKGVISEFEKLKKVFNGFSLGILHGRLKLQEKNKVLDSFRSGKVDILVATPVVEVGIDIPNATIMLIEAADRFGLAQLHQLRGRVGRGEKKSYCLLFSETKGEKGVKRLAAMTQSLSGFELAEIDLKLRGPGEIFGTRQHGIPELKIASWQDIDLIKRAKSAAEEILKEGSSARSLLT